MQDDDAARDEGLEPAEEPSAPPPPSTPEVPAPPPPPGPMASEEPATTVAPVPPPPPYTPPVEVMPTRPAPATDSSKLLAALGYVFPIIAFVVLFIDPYKNEKFVRFHAVQAIALWVIGLTWWIPLVGWVLSLLAFVGAVVGLIKAFQGQYWEVPVVYGVVKGFVEE